MIIKARDAEYSKVGWIPTGITGLDKILGGGVPTKRLTEISGPYSVGKTSLALLVTSHAQQEGFTAVWCDQEWAWEPNYAETIGVDIDELLLIQERHAEDALDDCEKFFAENKKVFMVIDAIGALSPKAESEKASGEKIIGGQAALIARFCRKVVPLLAINNSALLVLNHQFQDIMSGAMKTSGGAKLEYHKSISLSLKRKFGVQAKRGTDGKIFEVVIEAEIRKNKLAGTLGSRHNLYMEPGAGFLVQADAFQDALASGEITKVKNTYYAGNLKLGTAKKAKEWIKSPL